MNDDVRSPGSGSTPGPLSAQPPPGLGDPDPGKFTVHSSHFLIDVNQLIINRPIAVVMLRDALHRV